MGQLLHGSARTTEAVRRAIRLRQESVMALAKRYGVGPTTIRNWRKRSTTADLPMRPKEPRSTVLTPEEEAFISRMPQMEGDKPKTKHRACRENSIEHRLTKPGHPWTNGQALRRTALSRTPPSRLKEPRSNVLTSPAGWSPCQFSLI